MKLAAAPLKVTEVAPVKFEPRMSALVPTGPLMGVNELTVGAGVVTVKFDELVPVPFGVVMLIGLSWRPMARER